MKLAFVGLLLSFILSSCSSFETLLSKNAERRQFQIHNAWVRDTLAKPNDKYRKINRMSPVIAGDLIVSGNGLDGLVAFDRKRGHKVWRIDILNGVEAGAATINDMIFFGGNDGNFYAASLRNGKILWSYPAKSEILSEPTLDAQNGIIYFLSGNNVVYALEADSGKQVWTYSRQDTNNFSVRGGTKPTLKNDILYVGFSEGSLIAFNAKSGSPIWEIQLNKNKRFRDIDATPVIDGDQLYVAGYDDRLYCIRAQTGEIIWKLDGGSYSGITLDRERIYYPTSNGEVWALKKSDGSKIWSYALTSGVATGVSIYKGLVTFGESQGRLVFLDPGTGKTIGTFDPGRGILSQPALDAKENRLYFISGEANLYAVHAEWGFPSEFPHLR